MPRVATKLTPTKGGGFTARKRIPEDAQAEYERLYGVKWEARLSIGPGTPVLRARAQHREWLSEIESRIANIRAEKKGEGRLLTPKDARALAGEWYHWFTERHLRSARPPTYWEDLRGACRGSAAGRTDLRKMTMSLTTFGSVRRKHAKTCARCWRTGEK